MAGLREAVGVDGHDLESVYKVKHVSGAEGEHQAELTKACAEISSEGGELVEVSHSALLLSSRAYMSTVLVYRAKMPPEELRAALRGQVVPNLAALRDLKEMPTTLDSEQELQ